MSTPVTAPSLSETSAAAMGSPKLVAAGAGGGGGRHPSSSKMSSSLQQHISLLEIKKALLHFTVFLLGLIFLVAAYLNYVLFKVPPWLSR